MKNYDFDHNGKDWFLKAHGNENATKVFYGMNKLDALQQMKQHLSNGASVKIKKMNHIIQEERTYPKSSDPTQSPG